MDKEQYIEWYGSLEKFEEQISNLKEWDRVKVSNWDEWFWSIVKSIDWDIVKAEVNNNLVIITEVWLWDVFEFKKENILKIYDEWLN